MTTVGNGVELDHIEHLWQVDDDWPRTLKKNVEILRTYMDRGPVVATEKVDDSFSCRLHKVGGKHFVSTKYKESEWMDSEHSIRTVCRDKPYIWKLEAVLKYAPSLVKEEDDVSVHLGFIHYNPEGLPRKVTPNVIEYDLGEGSDGRVLAVVVVSVTDHNTGKVSFEHGIHSSDDVHVFDNSFFLEGLEEEIGTVLEFIEETSEGLDLAFSKVEDLPTLRMFLNSHNRKGWPFHPSVSDYVTFVVEREKNAVESLKTEIGRRKRIEKMNDKVNNIFSNFISYDTIFSMVHCFKVITDKILSGVEGEGVVFSYNDGTSNSLFKVVNREFTAENHRRWEGE